MGYIEYSSNNSGGDWWLTDQDWTNLEEAGWEVQWKKDEAGQRRWLGALATSAKRHGLTREEAIAEWEQITGQNAYDEGCPCCGQPHEFYSYDDEGNMVW